MFDPAVLWLDDQADRLACYAVKRAAGDTIANFTLSGQYREQGQAYQDIPGKDFSSDAGLEQLRALIIEALTLGGMSGIWLMLAGDGESVKVDGHYVYNDPQGMTWGKQWLMDNFARIWAALTGGDVDLTPYLVLVPGYDGVVPAWQPPSSVGDYLLHARAIVGSGGYLGLELSAGYSSWGDGGDNWTSDAGKAVDLILQEFPEPIGPPIPAPPNICDLPNDQKAPYYQVWQILARMLGPAYRWPADEPNCADNRNPPWYLSGGTPRGPFFYNGFEFDAYFWVRGYPPAMVEAHRQALRALGCAHVG